MGKWLLKPITAPSTVDRPASSYLACGSEEVRLEHSADLVERLLAELDRIEAALCARTLIAGPRPPAGPPPVYRPLPVAV
ncbi:hypothetical protein AB0I22_34550 [Streptomyces sp. NPDC050610]|uniref:hypothetical protein n=1 Tax=Streptomyces sp. NPDC050610 TaxID=3157097 RepID=UPI003448D4EA